MLASGLGESQSPSDSSGIGAPCEKCKQAQAQGCCQRLATRTPCPTVGGSIKCPEGTKKMSWPEPCAGGTTACVECVTTSEAKADNCNNPGDVQPGHPIDYKIFRCSGTETQSMGG